MDRGHESSIRSDIHTNERGDEMKYCKECEYSLVEFEKEEGMKECWECEVRLTSEATA